MAKFSLRRYDIQATVSMLLSLAGVLALFPLAFLVLRHLQWDQKIILYNAKGMRAPVTYAMGLVTIALGCAGFGFGWNSAGQRRNDKPGRSWAGFFLGAFAVTMAIVLLFLFQHWKEAFIS